MYNVNVKLLYYDVQPADVLSPEFIAWKAYGVDTLKWVVMAAAGHDDPREPLTAATRIFLPSTAWIREAIKRYMAMEKA